MDAREIVEPPSKKRKQFASHYQDDWKRIFNGVIAPLKLGNHHAWCIVCSRDVNVSAPGVYDVRMHLKSKIHKKKTKSALQHAPLAAFFKAKADTPDSTTSAEVMFAYFVAEHNLPTAIADHVSSLAPRMFPDSGIAKSCRTVAVFWLREFVFVVAHVTEWVSVSARSAAELCERTVSWNESDA